MQKTVLALLFLGFSSALAVADPTDLFGGVLIAHYPPQMTYCYVPACDYYNDTVAISDPSEQVNRTDRISYGGEIDIWYVIAAFTEEKTWCGTQFGLGDYNPYVFYMMQSGNCLEYSLEIPTPGWPGPLTGISIAATTTQYEGNYQPIYYFIGYTYYAAQGIMTPTVIPVTVDPSQNFIGFGNCVAPAGVWPAEGGALGVFTDGVAVYPQEPEPPSACCFPDGSCLVMIPGFCELGGGVPYNDTLCDPNPCPPPTASDEDSWGTIKSLYR